MESLKPQTRRRASVPLDQVDTSAYPFPLAPMYSLSSSLVSSGMSVKNLQPNSPLDGHPPPPSYDIALIPPEYPLAYSFSLLETSKSAMLLTPLLGSPNMQSSYHISVGHDPFIPTHLVTSVVKGSNDQGLYVGGFKTVISCPNHPQQPVYINGGEYKLLDVFQKRKKKKGAQRFTWGNKQIINLRWSCPQWPSGGRFTCHDPSDKTRVFAEFCVFNGIGNCPRAEPQLTVMPIGQGLLDDILISLLLLERQRLTAALDSCDPASHPSSSQDWKTIQDNSKNQHAVLCL